MGDLLLAALVEPHPPGEQEYWSFRLAQGYPLEAQLSGAIAHDGVET
jgi:hypothetical protein